MSILVKIKSIANAIYWAIYKLSKKGKQAYMFKQAAVSMQQKHNNRTVAKMAVVANSQKHAKLKKIVTFQNGRSVTKSKKSNHQIIEASRQENAQLLSENGLRITDSGKIKNA